MSVVRAGDYYAWHDGSSSRHNAVRLTRLRRWSYSTLWSCSDDKMSTAECSFASPSQPASEPSDVMDCRLLIIHEKSAAKNLLSWWRYNRVVWVGLWGVSQVILDYSVSPTAETILIWHLVKLSRLICFYNSRLCSAVSVCIDVHQAQAL